VPFDTIASNSSGRRTSSPGKRVRHLLEIGIGTSAQFSGFVETIRRVVGRNGLEIAQAVIC